VEPRAVVGRVERRSRDKSGYAAKKSGFLAILLESQAGSVGYRPRGG